jgi:hypothetical protein
MLLMSAAPCYQAVRSHPILGKALAPLSSEPWLQVFWFWWSGRGWRSNLASWFRRQLAQTTLAVPHTSLPLTPHSLPGSPHPSVGEVWRPTCVLLSVVRIRRFPAAPVGRLREPAVLGRATAGADPGDAAAAVRRVLHVRVMGWDGMGWHRTAPPPGSGSNHLRGNEGL